MKEFTTPIRTLARKAVFAVGAMWLLAGVSAQAQDLFISNIELDWDPGASTEIDEETQIISFKPGDPITYSVTYGRSNTSSPPNGPQNFRIIVSLSPDGDARLQSEDSDAPINLDSHQLDLLGSYPAGTFSDFAPEPDPEVENPPPHPITLEESGSENVPVPAFFRTRTRTVMLPRNFTGTYFLTARIRVSRGAPDPDLTDNSPILATARIQIQPDDSATVERVSSTPDGGNATERSEAPSVSADGRYVTYHSEATTIVPGFAYPAGVAQIYLRDNLTDQTTLITQRGGTPGNQESLYPAISADGRYVVFQSTATNLVTSDTNQQTDIFLYQIATGVTTRISVSNSGQQTARGSFLPSISEDGWTISFESDATNLIDSPFPDTNGLRDVYVYRRFGDPAVNGGPVEGLIFPASITRDGVFGNGASWQSKMSLDGESVVFSSYSDNLPTASVGSHSGKAFEPVTPKRFNNRNLSEIYVKDLTYVDDLMSGGGLSDLYGYVVRASFKRTMDYAIGFELDRDSLDPVVSHDGRYVAFASRASNVQPYEEYTNASNVSQVYLLNRQVDLSKPRDQEGNTSLSLITQGSDGDFADEDAMEPVISGNGRHVGYRTLADDLQPSTVTRSDGVVFNTYYRSQWDFPRTEEEAQELDEFELIELYQRATLGEQWIENYSETNGTSDIYIRNTGVVSIEVNDGGSGYSTNSPPVVNIVGGGGSGAQAVAVVENGRVTRIDVTNPGAGYTLPNDLPSEHPLYDDRLQVHVSGNASATPLLTDGNERITVSKFGEETHGVVGDFSVPSSRNLALSADGRYLVFASDANNRGSFIFGKSNWHPLDTNQTRDVFMVDRRVGEVLSPAQGVLPIVQVQMDGHPGTFGSNRVIRVTAFDGASNDVAPDGSQQSTRGQIARLRLFANEQEFSSVTLTGIGTERAVARTSWTIPSIAGAYQIYAVAEDIDGNRVLSTPVNVDVSPPFSLPPLVNLTVTPSTITLGDTVTIRAFPSDPDNGVSFVRYFSNGTQIGLTVDEHVIQYTPSAAENYEIIAVVSDGPPPEELPPPPALRNTRMSSTQILRVIPLPSPQVEIVSPAAGETLRATVGEPVFFELQALTSNPMATISAVNLEVRGRQIPATRLGLTSTYRVEWRPRVTEVGTVEVRATAVDSMGAEGASDPRTVEVGSAPAGGDPVAVAIDTLLRPELVGIPPTEQLVPVLATDTLYTHQRLVVPILVGTEVENPPGTITIDLDPDDVESVSLYASGGFVGRATQPNSTTGAFEIDVDLSLLGPGEHDLVAVVRDKNNNFKASEPVTITVLTPAPSVTLLEPAVDPGTGEIGVQTGDVVRLVIDARSPDPLITISEVSVTAGDETLGRAVRVPGTHTYIFDWVPTSTGLFEIGVNATDSTGATRISPSTRFRVTEALSARPDVFIINPDVESGNLDDAFLLTDRSEWPFAAIAVAGTRDIESVEFFAINVPLDGDADAPLPPSGGISMGFASPEPSFDVWRLNFDLSEMLPGTYLVTAVAEDDLGRRGVSAPIAIQVVRGIGPGLPQPRLTVSDVDIIVNIDEVRFRVLAAAEEGHVDEVTLFTNSSTAVFDDFDNPIVREGLDPVPFVWESFWVSAGTWNVFAVARDSLGNTRISNEVRMVSRSAPNLEKNPADPNNPEAFVFQIFDDFFEEAPSGAIVTAYVNALQSGSKTRGQVVAELMAYPDFEMVPWVVVAYLTVLRDFPSVQQLHDGIELLEGGGDDPGGDDEIIVGPNVPGALPLLVAEILGSDEFWIRHGESGLTMEDDDLLDILHKGKTHPIQQERLAEIAVIGRISYLTNLTIEKYPEDKGIALRASLILLLLQRDIIPGEMVVVPSNLAAAAEFIITRPEFVTRFPGPSSFLSVNGNGPLNGVRASDWFGTFGDRFFNYAAGTGWLQHTEHGWVYVGPSSQTENGVWLWDHIQKDWLWTSDSSYRLLYSSDEDRWLYYVGGSPSARTFRAHDGSNWSAPFTVTP